MHIHRYRITSLYYEQPTDVEGIWCDYSVKTCRCGAQKHVMKHIYFAQRLRIPLISRKDISYMGLDFKQEIT